MKIYLLSRTFYKNIVFYKKNIDLCVRTIMYTICVLYLYFYILKIIKQNSIKCKKHSSMFRVLSLHTDWW